MNKRLTDRERNALKRWIDNPQSKPEEFVDAELSTLIGWVFESEQAACEEVERLKETLYGVSKLAEKRYRIIEAAESEIERLKEEKERILKQMEHLANKPIAVFGEGFGYEEHYRWLKDDLKSLVAFIQRIQEGTETNE